MALLVQLTVSLIVSLIVSYLCISRVHLSCLGRALGHLASLPAVEFLSSRHPLSPILPPPHPAPPTCVYLPPASDYDVLPNVYSVELSFNKSGEILSPPPCVNVSADGNCVGGGMVVAVSVPLKNQVIIKYKPDASYTPAPGATINLRGCYAAVSVVNRAWRKTNNIINVSCCDTYFSLSHSPATARSQTHTLAHPAITLLLSFMYAQLIHTCPLTATRSATAA